MNTFKRIIQEKKNTPQINHPFYLPTKSVQSPALPLEGINHIQTGDCLALCVFGVSNGVSDNVLQKGFEHAPSFLVDHCGNALDPPTAGKPTNGRLRDALDVVAEDLAVSFGASFAETFADFTAPRHDSV